MGVTEEHHCAAKPKVSWGRFRHYAWRNIGPAAAPKARFDPARTGLSATTAAEARA